MSENQISSLVGKIPTRIDQERESITMHFTDGSVGTFYHEKDCCEYVWVEDVSGSWEDLIGNPILTASERSQSREGDYWSETWTFYTFRTIAGTVDVRWCGQSNGYYSESVDFILSGPTWSN